MKWWAKGLIFGFIGIFAYFDEGHEAISSLTPHCADGERKTAISK